MKRPTKRDIIPFLIITLILGIIFIFIIINSGKRVELWSPNRNFKLIADGKDSPVVLEIYARDKKLVFKDETGISPRCGGWSVEWQTDDKILMRSSDIGDFFYQRTAEHKWIRTWANQSVSPDKMQIVRAVWDSSDKKVTLVIGIPSSYYDGLDIIHEIHTDVIVNDLVGCVAWERNDLISLKGVDRKYYWQRENSGKWNQILNTTAGNSP